MSEQERLIAELESDPRTLIGKTITAVEVGGYVSGNGNYANAQELRLTFSDGTRATVGYWAAYADDDGLELEITPPETGENDG